ncbi:MAG TPA: immunoglobulin domain-containing protein [Candidatus Acidoferrum sp.]|nr:immunoglobulin domain-containing protein [Candidatus Acidoferrum sp.]
MNRWLHGARAIPRLAAVLLACTMILPARATLRDGGIDPSDLGKGDWIYQMDQAVAQCNGNAPSVTDVPSLMIYLKNQGVRYIIVKAGTGTQLFSSSGFSPQFTSNLVSSAHAAGLWIFGYNRSYATNTAGEVGIANYVFQQGADGFVWDAESEWESGALGSQGSALAIAQCSQVRSNWPSKFLAHSPFAFISVHSTFPYKEFGYYCDAAFPQVYWVEFGMTPTAAEQRMSSEWQSWQNGLSGQWVNSKKPIAADGQGYNGSGTVTASQITEFVTALKTDANPATAGGYKGVNYWVCEDHPPDVWSAIRTNNIGDVPTNNAPVIGNISAGSVTASAATITWTTDQSADAVVEYGLDSTYGSAVTNSTLIYYHSVGLTGLSPYTSYHYRVKSRNSNNKQGISADAVFSTTAATVTDVIVESYLPSGSLNSNPPYTDSGFVAYSTCKSSASGLTGPAKVQYATGGGGSSPSVTLRPTLAIPGGTYDVYVTHCATSCSADITVTVGQANCSGLPASTPVFQSAYANAWTLVGRMVLNASVTVPTITFTRSGGTLSGSSRMYSDGYKFVYVPPPPTAPSVALPPQSQTVTQGYSASFSVAASGTPLLFYQWRFNGTNTILGATASVYTRSSVQAADAGKYSVLVTNAYGATNTQDATLTVLVPAEIAVSPTDVTTALGQNAGFSAAGTGTPPLTYQWLFNGSNIAGATGTRLTLTNVQPANAGTYAVVVSNLYGTDQSYNAFLTVLVPSIHIDSLLNLPDGSHQLQVSSGPGTFGVEAGSGPFGWTQISSLTVTGAAFQYTDPATNQPNRFYRIHLLP